MEMDSQVLEKKVQQNAEEQNVSVSSSSLDVAVELSKHIHEIASLLTKNKLFQEFFVSFMQALKLSAADQVQLEEQWKGGSTQRPIYNVLSHALSSWLGTKGSEATFQVLMQVLKDLEMEDARAIVEKYYKALGKDDTNGPVPVNQTDIPELTRSLQDDENMDTDFLKFLNALGLPNSLKFSIKREHVGVYNSGPFYNLVSKALETWKSRHGQKVATYKALVDALEKNGLGAAAADVKKYFVDNVMEDDGSGNR